MISQESLDFLKSYCAFEHPNHVWVLVGIVRCKDSLEHSMENKWMRRLIIRCPEDIVSCYNDIKCMGNRKGVNYRMYVSLNARDVTKTLFHFQQNLLSISFDVCRGIDKTFHQISRLDSIWKTELLQIHNRATKRFLLDIDSKDADLLNDIESYMKSSNMVIRANRPTINGHHIVFDACDTRGLIQQFKGKPLDIHKDSLLFVEAWKQEM